MFAYVILHYKTLDITIKCISHLLKISPVANIVIVDNGSCDSSGEKLQEKYSNKPNIKVIISKINLGFARGNNLGYHYIKKNVKAEYIVVMNNDVIISQPDFEISIKNYLTTHQLDICGPDIITSEDKHQNPLMTETFTTIRLIKKMLIDCVRLFCLKVGIFSKKILTSYSENSKTYHKQQVNLKNIENCILHGSCVIFTGKWLENEEFAFLPVTFLYAEEMILFDYCQQKKYKSGICPDAKVLHLGGKSTQPNLNEKDKQIFKTRMLLKSSWKWLKLRFFPYNKK